MKASDRLLINRIELNGMLHISRDTSYRMFRRSRFRGKIAMADVREALNRTARNGAKWDGGEIVVVTGAKLGISERSLYRALKHAPHFRISRKVAMVEADKINDFLKSK